MNLKDKQKLVGQISKLIIGLNTIDKKEILEEVMKEEGIGIPISIFNSNLSGLELIIRYLKDSKKISFKDIANQLNRKLSTIYNTYNNSIKKYKGNLDIYNAKYFMPTNIFFDRKFSILESIVAYLKINQGISLTQISALLHKNYSTIMTVYRRYNLKNAK